jgi:hypothetical protein
MPEQRKFQEPTIGTFFLNAGNHFKILSPSRVILKKFHIGDTILGTSVKKNYSHGRLRPRDLCTPEMKVIQSLITMIGVRSK